MKYSTTIDNISSIEWGLSIQEAYLYAWIFSVPAWASCVKLDGQDFYFASRSKAILDNPMLTDKPDTMYRHYKSLEEKGLIVTKKIDSNDYISITEKGKLWNRSSEYSEKNPIGFGKKSENNEKHLIVDTIINNTFKEKENFSKTPYDKYVEKHKPTMVEMTSSLPAKEKELMVTWLKYKFEVKKGYKGINWVSLFISRIKEFGHEEVKRSIDQSMASEYEDYFPKKPFAKTENNTYPPKFIASKGVKRD